MFQSCCKDEKESETEIDDKYDLIKFTKFYQISNYFSYLSIIKSCVTGSIVHNVGKNAVVDVAHLKPNEVSSIKQYQNLKKNNFTQNLRKVEEKTQTF